MLLRASGEKEGRHYEPGAVTDGSLDSGVAQASWLIELTDRTIRGRFDELAAIRPQAASDMGEAQMVDTLVVAAAFNGITRVADATGIPLDENTRDTTVGLRRATGIDRFDYAAKSDRYR